MHVVAHLCAAAHAGPGVNHGALTNPCANIDIAGHQNSPFGNETATAGDSRRHDAHTCCTHFVFAQVCKFGFDFVKKSQVASAHEFVVFQAKAQQHSFFNPLMGGPLTNGFASGHSQLAAVEL